jgi:hypothetical protein
MLDKYKEALSITGFISDNARPHAVIPITVAVFTFFIGGSYLSGHLFSSRLCLSEATAEVECRLNQGVFAKKRMSLVSQKLISPPV